MSFQKVVSVSVCRSNGATNCGFIGTLGHKHIVHGLKEIQLGLVKLVGCFSHLKWCCDALTKAGLGILEVQAGIGQILLLRLHSAMRSAQIPEALVDFNPDGACQEFQIILCLLNGNLALLDASVRGQSIEDVP